VAVDVDATISELRVAHEREMRDLRARLELETLRFARPPARPNACLEHPLVPLGTAGLPHSAAEHRRGSALHAVTLGRRVGFRTVWRIRGGYAAGPRLRRRSRLWHGGTRRKGRPCPLKRPRLPAQPRGREAPHSVQRVALAPRRAAQVLGSV
jgi:hypothetical protein